MTGCNELRLNEKTMCEAVQYWLTNKVLNPHEPAPVVNGVAFTTSSGTDEFIIELVQPTKHLKSDD